MNSDFKELLDALNEAEVDYIVVGGYAVIYHSQPRFTKDIDIWLRPSRENARKLMRAFAAFGMPLIDIAEADFAIPGTQYVIGRPPTAIDFLTSLGPLDFDKCFSGKVVDVAGGTRIPYMSKEDLLEAKTNAARPQDLADIRSITLLDEKE